MPRPKGTPLVQAQMRLPQKLLGKIDTAAATWGKKPNRTATTIRLIEDGFKWWAREDMEQDTTLGMVTQTHGMVAQMHDRLATVLAIQNAMAYRLGLMEGDGGASFKAAVETYKAAILQEGHGNGLGTVGGLDEPGDDDGDDGPDEDDEPVQD